MSDDLARQLRELVPAIIQRWEDRVREEVPAASAQQQVILRTSLDMMLEVLAKTLSDETDPQTAARDTAYITVHAENRANQAQYSLEEMIMECQVLQEVVLETLWSNNMLAIRDRTLISRYFSALVRLAAGEYARVQAERVARINRSKDEFLAMLGHELRNPLGAISSSLFLLREGAGRGQLPAHALAVADRQVGYMTQMVNDIVDIARIGAGQIILHKSSVDLGLVVWHAVEAARELFDKHQHCLTVLHKQEPIYVEADPTRLGQCLSHLLANAAKYTPSGGSVEVIMERDGKEAVVRIRDNGIGIPPHLLPDIFELFQQGNRNLDATEGGLGIGLTVVQRLVELHGGRVEAISDGLGKGSEFLVRLPISGAIPSDTHAPPPRKHLQPSIRVLLVEDNHDSAEMMSHLLKLLGHHVAVAKDGPAALETVIWHRPDLALVDIGLPGMTGYELARQLRASKSCPPSMKLVALTGYAANAELLAAAAFDSHITKPMDFPRLEQTLASVIRTSVS